MTPGQAGANLYSQSLQLNDSSTDGNCNRLGAITGAQLFHDVFDVNLDRFLSYEEPVGDVTIAVPFRDVLKDFDLTRSQSVFA